MIVWLLVPGLEELGADFVVVAIAAGRELVPGRAQDRGQRLVVVVADRFGERIGRRLRLWGSRAIEAALRLRQRGRRQPDAQDQRQEDVTDQLAHRLPPPPPPPLAPPPPPPPAGRPPPPPPPLRCGAALCCWAWPRWDSRFTCWPRFTPERPFPPPPPPPPGPLGVSAAGSATGPPGTTGTANATGTTGTASAPGPAGTTGHHQRRRDHRHRRRHRGDPLHRDRRRRRVAQPGSSGRGTAGAGRHLAGSVRIADALPDHGRRRPCDGSRHVASAAGADVGTIVVAVDVGRPVGIDVHVVARPARVPVPAAEHRTGRSNAHAPRQAAHQGAPCGTRGIGGWGIARIGPLPIGRVRVIGRHVHDLRIGRLNGNGGLAALSLGRDGLFLAGLQGAGRGGLGAQPLDRRGHVGLLTDQRIAQLLGPVEMVVELFQNRREGDQGLDADIPGLVGNGSYGGIALEVGVGLRPAGRLDDLERIARGHQDLRQQRIVVERDRRQHLIELLRRERLGLRLRLRRQCHNGQCRERKGQHLAAAGKDDGIRLARSLEMVGHGCVPPSRKSKAFEPFNAPA